MNIQEPTQSNYMQSSVVPPENRGHKQIRPKGRENDRQRLPDYLLLVYENMSKNLYFSATTRDRPSFADAKVQTLYNMTKYFYKKIEELQK